MSGLFEIDENDGNSIIPIVLVDSSSSTNAIYMGSYNVFMRQMLAIKQLPFKKYRLLFWNAPGSSPKFPGGVLPMMSVIDGDKLDQPFTYVQTLITRGCGTEPQYAFKAIPKSWVSTTGMTHIIYVTDGQLGNGAADAARVKPLVAAAIKEALAMGRIVLHVITVEAVDRDFKDLETQAIAAGGDFYDTIVKHNLTGSVSKFVSYTPNNDNGFVHMERAVPTPGFIPYGSRRFNELRVLEFLEYIRSEINTAATNQDELMRIIQNLGATLIALNRDKPISMVNERMEHWASLFDGTVLDPAFVRFVLVNAVKTEEAGSAPVFAAYRKSLREMYANATDMMKEDIPRAIGMGGVFITYPVLDTATGADVIVMGHRPMIDKPIQMYPNGACEINSIRLPVLPFLTPLTHGEIGEQCLRQWIRVICSRLYGVSVMDDSIIYQVLGTVLQVVLSPLDETIKNAFRRIGFAMLNKKRLNSQTTEIERLVAGEAPIPNDGRIETLWRYLDAVKARLGLEMRRMTLWYAMCLALGDLNLVSRQRVHCEQDIATDGFTGLDPTRLRVKEVVYFKIPIESMYYYTCSVTLDDLANSGGYRILPHGRGCEPMTLISQAGLDQMLDKPQYTMCPVCYTSLTRASFEKVGPKPTIEITAFNGSTNNPFSSSSSSLPSSPVPEKKKEGKAKKIGVWVVMKGTVGSGKSTFTTAIENATRERGGICIVASPDRYCKTGIPMSQALGMVARDLRRLDTIYDDTPGPLVVVIDTCGERHKDGNKSSFDYDFVGWPEPILVWPNLIRNTMPGYMA
jgi:hypothetical protein